MDDQATIRTYGQPNLPDGGPDRPLLTFALFAYNQEKYIRKAVEGALAQTYSPMEIILSDDCSSDRTFEIMEEMAREYRGRHLVKVRRGQVNRGVLGHVLSVAQLAKGEIIIVAAGDDISIPERSEVIAEALSGATSLAFSSDDVIIDENGKEQDWDQGRIDRRRAWHASNPAWIHGASAAYRSCFLKELPVPTWPIFYEDMVFSDLIALSGATAIRSNAPLIKYRYHINNLSQRLGANRSLQDAEDQAVVRWKRAMNAKKYCLDFMLAHKNDRFFAALTAKKIALEYGHLQHAANWRNANLFDRLKFVYFAICTGNIRSALPRVFGERVFFRLKSIMHA